MRFARKRGLSCTQAARIASGLGGGMGRMREVCGAVSAMFLAEGLLRGYDDPKAEDDKAALYARIRSMADAFRAKNGSILCRELLIDVAVTPGGVPEERNGAYYERRPCACYVEDAARILAEALQTK